MKLTLSNLPPLPKSNEEIMDYLIKQHAILTELIRTIEQLLHTLAKNETYI